MTTTPVNELAEHQAAANTQRAELMAAQQARVDLLERLYRVIKNRGLRTHFLVRHIIDELEPKP